MAGVTQTIRVIRTWEVEVEAVYGDTPEMLKAKVSEEYLDATVPDAETRVILEHHDSEYDALGAFHCPDCTPDVSCAWHGEHGRDKVRPGDEAADETEES